MEFEKQKAYYVSENEQLNFEETIQLQQYFYNTNSSTTPIHLTIGQGNTKTYDGLIATNKKYYLNDLGLTLKDYIKIQNNIPVIITYTATKTKKTKENYVTYSYEFSDYKQLKVQFISPEIHREYYNKDIQLLEHGDQVYSSLNSITETIFNDLLSEFAVKNNIKLSLSDENAIDYNKLSYNDNKYLIELIEIPWIEIETQGEVKLKMRYYLNNNYEDYEIIIGQTDKLILEEILNTDANRKPNLLVTNETIKANNNFIINYCFQLSILKKGE